MSSELVKLYNRIEEKLGKETAEVLLESIEELVKEKGNYLKFELKEELLSELATKKDLEILEQKLERKIESVKNELLKWLIVLFLGQATFIVGLVFTLVKLLGPSK